MEVSDKVLNIISLGAGVQSSTMALMAAHGEFDVMPDAAIFADTQAEPKEVYEWLDWLEKRLPFPVYRVTKGNLKEKNLEIKNRKSDGKPYSKINIPVFTDGERKGMFVRQCTADYKILPIRRKIKELLGIKRARKELLAYQWIGISIDEIQRMKPSRDVWLGNIHPLIEKDMTRGHCLEWMKKNNYPLPPRSACTFCPFHSDKEWINLSEHDFEEAVQFEREVHRNYEKGLTMFKDKPYLHNSCKPLDQVHFDVNKSLDLFGNECEGMCGI